METTDVESQMDTLRLRFAGQGRTRYFSCPMGRPERRPCSERFWRLRTPGAFLLYSDPDALTDSVGMGEIIHRFELATLAYVAAGALLFWIVMPAFVREVQDVTGDRDEQRKMITDGFFSCVFGWPRLVVIGFVDYCHSLTRRWH